MKRHVPLVVIAVLVAAAFAAPGAQAPAPKGKPSPQRAGSPPPAPPFTVVEATIPEMRAAMEQGRVTSRELVQQSLARIATYEERLNAVMTVNPHALDEADARDRERARGQGARAAARHPDRAQGQHPHDRHADDRRRAGVRRLRAALRGDAHEEPARRRRDHHRQDRDDRAGQLGGRRADADAGQLQRGRRLRLQPVRSRGATRARRPSTAGRRWAPAARARASAPPRASGPPTSAPRRPARS